LQTLVSSRSRRIALLVLLLVAAVCARLGVWQLSRLRQRRAVNREILKARAEPPVSLNQAGRRDSAALAQRWVTATGRYDRRNEVVLRGQTYEGTPGVQVVTPLRLEGSDTAALVIRGFVPAPDAVRAELDSLDEPGEHRVTGLALPMGSGGGNPLEVAGHSTWVRLDFPALSRTLPYPILPLAILQTPDSSLPRYPLRLSPPDVDDGPHLNYAVQWFLFSALSVAFALVVVAKTGGSRRAP
jgi:surfeit locus 1 family protein